MEFIKNKGMTKRNVLYCPELRDFITESRKCQTLYANCEGSYSRRVVNLQDKSILENFIYCTMYFDGVYDRHNEQNSLKGKHVEQILDKMIATGKKFDLGNEIHFGVIWVYYFTYEDKTQKATPVFKIYKKKYGNEAVFLDASLNLHESWDYYLDCAEFPVSFLCVPRNGDYCFQSEGKEEDKILDLEFVRSKRLTTKKADDFVPFCQVVVRPWLIKIKCFTLEKMKQIKEIICALWSSSDETKDSFFKVVLFGFLGCLKAKDWEFTTVKVLEILLVNGLMFLNIASKEDSWKNCFTPVFLSNTLKTFVPKFTSFSDAIETLKGLQCEAMHVLELLRKPVIEWEEILKSFCLLFQNALHVLFAISPFIPRTRILENLLLLSDKAQETNFLNNQSN